MNVHNNTVHEILQKLKLYFEEDFTVKYENEEPPLRSELYSIEQMKQHGRRLAESHKISTVHSPDWLLKRLTDNDRILNKVRSLLVDSVKKKNIISPAGEWLLDNFYLVEEQVRTGRSHLPKGYSEGLPQLSNGKSKGLPRVYDIALEIIAHTDGRIDMETISGFIHHYQSVSELNLGELWAIPIMLRLALIENLRRVSSRIAIDRINRNLAEFWTTQMIDIAEQDPKGLIMVIADMARSNPPIESSFVAELTRRLLWKGPDLALPLTWVEQRLLETGHTINELVNIDNQKQAADQVSISNSIGSLRFLTAVEWREFVETMSVVERVLQHDPGDTYGKMDFFTRDHYRHIVERIAKHSKYSEKEVANKAIELAQQRPADAPGAETLRHVGYYLAGNGSKQLEDWAKPKYPFKVAWQQGVKRNALLLYAGSITTTMLIISIWLFNTAHPSLLSAGQHILLSLLLVLCTSHFSTGLISWLTTITVRPDFLPRLDFSFGIPEEHSTLVVVPCMLTNARTIEELVEKLEVHYLANKNEHLYFGLLTDFADAKEEVLPGDDVLLGFVKERINALNDQYSNGTEDLFFLFHRPRKWNEVDKVWMGYERKRGKLAHLNILIREKDVSNFAEITGDISSLAQVKYVITLDADTILPREAAWKMVGTMAHPLNRPYCDEHRKRVSAGYGILQPRVSTSMPKSVTSLYGKWHASEAGIDPYTRLTSDVYQDLFNEGSFIGKGIYDVAAFEWALKDRFPENRILSHDLLEGSYARAGLLTDVELFEEYPSKYSADVNRRHRWIRGDWQIASWMLPFVPGADKKYHKNPLSGISKWKIFDNLRRSITALAFTTLIFFAWMLLPAPFYWLCIIIALLLLPAIIGVVWTLIQKPDSINSWDHTRHTLKAFSQNLTLHVFQFIILPYEAYYTLHAILRTSWRMFVSKRKLLEWNPFGNLERTSDSTVLKAYSAMWVAPLAGVACILFFATRDLPVLFVAAPVSLLWIFAPLIAWYVSRPLAKKKATLSEEQLYFLRKLSRKTWSFFENFVTAEDNWLPPDNYQEHPGNMVAHRTSPTNIGLSLLSNLSAYDFGYLTLSAFLRRTTNTMQTMEHLEKFHGHFYNWYDTITLKPLHPMYISTVDSGNLIGHLIVLRQGLITTKNQKIVHPRLFKAIYDTYTVLEESMPAVASSRFRELIVAVQDEAPGTLPELKQKLEELMEAAAAIQELVNTEAKEDANRWLQATISQCKEAIEEFQLYTPWLFLPAAPQAFASLTSIESIPTLTELHKITESICLKTNDALASPVALQEKEWLLLLQTNLEKTRDFSAKKLSQIDELASQCMIFSDVDYSFLYDKSRYLFSIGYNVEEFKRDAGHYDLLASEARLGVFVAIAQGKLPQESWFLLGRLLADGRGYPVLLSWSGSMFEYLMPNLVMPEYENTLLFQTSLAAVQRQMEYGKQRKIPWGISESGYNMVDKHLNYQYRAFGVPDTGLKRGLAEDLVIAPYASALALMVLPAEATENLQRLSEDGFEGKFGFYEAVDYTQSRLPRGQSRVIIQSYMAHHQGMSFLSYAYLLLDQPMQKRFIAEPQFQSALLLLQERIPKITAVHSYVTDIAEFNPTVINAVSRVVSTPHTAVPEVQLLSNGSYHVMISNAGAGYSRWKDHAVTRWREDTTCDNWGMFCYVKDLDTGRFWSATHQPSLVEAEHYEVVFTQGRAEFRRGDIGIETYTEIAVSPEDDIEIRRVHIINKSGKRRKIELTSYGEVVLNSQPADMLHRSFSNLFIQTEILDARHAILCNRRRRASDDPSPWLFHLMTVDTENASGASYETDRAKFMGRGNTIVNPEAMQQNTKLSGTQGPVLDPVVSMRYTITLEEGASVVADLLLGVSDTREGCLALVEKYQDKHHKDRVFELAWTHSQVVLRQINAEEQDAQLYAKLAGSVIYHNPLLRAEQGIISSNRKNQSNLWSQSISGDLPIVLLQIEEAANMHLVKQMIQAHAYWKLKGLTTDLVIMNDDHGGYRQVLQHEILNLIAVGNLSDITDKPGGIFVRSTDQLSNEDRILLQSVARIIISHNKGTLEDQVKRKKTGKISIPLLTPTESQARAAAPIPVADTSRLLHFNRLGGFAPDGKEYVITLQPGSTTPAPWVNIIANPSFGTVITEAGQAYTWTENAHTFRLTPWYNDSVTDMSGEAFYIRDEVSGKFWSPVALPARGKNQYTTRHGFGYSVFSYSEEGIDSEMSVSIDQKDKLKNTILKITNNSGYSRKLSATGYAEWILGDLRSKSSMHIVTEIDESGALFAHNPFNIEFSDRIAFLDVDGDFREKSFTADRTEFIGRNGTLAEPAAMRLERLSGKIGAALDPCAAFQVFFDLEPGASAEIVFRMGAGNDANDARGLVNRFRKPDASTESLNAIKAYWKQTLNTVQVDTPDSAFNILANGWLAYQTMCSRLWARSGYYQSGGAYGFRDQLQDVLSVLHSSPAVARAQLLLCASRQFREGDVQHWWHPPGGRGVRTRCSDDYLWLPYVTSRYVTTTGDHNVLNEQVAFLEGRLLNDHEESYYDLPIVSGQKATLYEHCMKAIEHGLRFGAHGLPLMGSGDWNDGMDRVGQHGKGESVWLGFFLYDILESFGKVATLHGDEAFAGRCKEEAEKLQQHIEQHAWDGAWYRRAYFDDGTPLGSSSNDECSIDSISQSWAVLSGAAPAERTAMAMSNATERLVNKDIGVIQLLDPPFDKSPMDPGYIKGYLPGIRENGGQYTHAAVWMVMAHAALGNKKEAWELMGMINPINHSNNEEKMREYVVEPYVAAADIYAVAPNTGRGGWTWYTGSAAWMYQLMVERLIGLTREGNKLSFAPCLPDDWDNCKIRYTYRGTIYRIVLDREGQGDPGIVLDGTHQDGNFILLQDDGIEHDVSVRI